jgi:hypothetical protein
MTPRRAPAPTRRSGLARPTPIRWTLLATVAAGLASAPARADRRADDSAPVASGPGDASARARDGARDPATSPILLVGPPELRLLAQIRHELAASGFPVIEHAPGPAGSDGGAFDAAGALGPGAARAAVVVQGDGRVCVWMAGADGAPARVRAELTVDRGDPHARRRACLAVVEYLRFGVPGDPPPAAPASTASTASTAPPATPVAVDPPFDPAPTDLLAAALAAGDQVAPGPRRPWGLSAATTVNFDSGMGEPTSHAQLTAQLPIGERWAITVSGLWPVLGAQFQTHGQVVRMWTMGAAAGLRWALPGPLPRVQPFLGAALGARFVLSDAESIETRQGRVVFTPSATVGGSAGLLVELRPLVHLLLEANVAWMGLLPQDTRTDWERAAARGRAAHAALGVLFEY